MSRDNAKQAYNSDRAEPVNIRTSCASTIVLLAVIMSGLLARATGAQDSSSTGRQDDVKLQLSTKSSVYRQGELIPLELSFTSSLTNRYQVNMASYDRSGRMNYEKFLVEPSDGTSDPLLVYFSSRSSFLGGGLT